MQTKDLLKLIAWEGVNPLLLRAKKRRVYRFDASWRGLNLGCGLDNPANWVGIDGGITHVFMHTMPNAVTRAIFRTFRMAKNYSFEEYAMRVKQIRIIHHDLRFGIPFASETVPNIYSSHFLEHLTRAEAKQLLTECFRVMRSGGLIRICVPSLDSEAGKLREALEAYHQGDIQPIQPWVTDDRFGFYGPYSHHRWMYNTAELRAVLSDAGFEDVAERTFRGGAMPDVEQLDTRTGIYIEARKP